MRALDWKRGDDAHTPRALLLTNDENVTNAAWKIKDLSYNFCSKRFERISDGTTFADADFEALAQSGDARASGVGRGTLKRTAVTTAVLSADGSARPGLLGTSRLGLSDVADSETLDAAIHKALYPRSSLAGGMPVAVVKTVADSAGAPWLTTSRRKKR